MRTRLAYWRLARGYSQEELAQRSGLPLGTLRRVEQMAQQRPPDLRHLQNLAIALGCHLDDLLEEAWRAWTPFPGGPRTPPKPDANWKPPLSSTRIASEPWWARNGAAAVKPVTPVAGLRRSYGQPELERTFDLELVAALTGMQPAYIARALGRRPRRVSLAQVMELLDLDAFSETFVPRSRIPDYLLRSRNANAGLLGIDDAAQLLVGDAHELIQRLPDGSVQCVVTSSPYWATRLYEAHVAVAWADGETAPYGHEQTPEGFIRHTVELMFLLKRALTPIASVWWNLMDTYNTRTPIRKSAAATLVAMAGSDARTWSQQPARRYSAGHSFLKDGEQCHIPARVAERAARIGYWTKSIITWRKTGYKPEAVNSRVSRQLEYILHLSPSRTPLFCKLAYHRLPPELGGRNDSHEPATVSDVWSLPTSNGLGGHGAQFPLSLPARCIALSTGEGDLILDPAIGSGTSAIATVRLRAHLGPRRFIGFDASEDYIAVAERRLADAGLPR